MSALAGPVAERVDPATERALRSLGLERAAAAIAAEVGAARVVHGTAATEHPFVIDAVPRVLAGDEWDALAAGMVQRTRALEAFVADCHGPQHAIADGVVPADLLDGCPWWEPESRALPRPAQWIGIAGPDVVRAADGTFQVLEDNVRTPTMMAYAVAARAATTATLCGRVPQPRPVRAPLVEALCTMLAAAAPDAARPRAALLSDGGRSVVRWELGALGRLLGLPVVEPHELTARGDRLVVAATGRPVDVLWRRTSEERLAGDDGRLNHLGELLARPLAAGTLAVVNAFGTGVADDKRTFAHVPDLIRFFLGEEPLLAQPRTYDLGAQADRAEALPRLEELVLKPRGGSGGHGVLIGPHATPAERTAARERIEADPAGWIAQEPVAISTHPTLVEGRLQPRHCDLRAFCCATGRPDAPYAVPSVALSRFALAAGDLVVNCSQGGGGKDVRIVD